MTGEVQRSGVRLAFPCPNPQVVVEFNGRSSRATEQLLQRHPRAMKALRLDLWAVSLQQSPRNTRLHLLGRRVNRCITCPSTSPSTATRRAFSQCPRTAAAHDQTVASTASATDSIRDSSVVPRNFPSHESATRSAKLAALHARLSLPTRLPLKTLARCLVDPSVDPRPGCNNGELAVLGQELLGYYTSEHLICHYPRLPMSVLLAAQYAYVGPATLAAMRKEWGVEIVAAPGPEVDPGLLQFKRQEAGNMMGSDGLHRLKDMPQPRTEPQKSTRTGWWQGEKRSMTSRITMDDQFGDLQLELRTDDNARPFPGAPMASRSEPDGEEHLSNDALSTPPETFAPTLGLVNMDTPPATVEAASASFVRALAGALYLHAGSAASKNFHTSHVLSRHLALHQLFNFTYPTRDLSKLCAREGFEPPVARLISETGRLSRTPVFVVGVFSGDDKLGEAAGASLNEGRVRAAAAALRSWYLYSPPDTEVVLPSEVEGTSKKVWKAQMVDPGEIVA